MDFLPAISVQPVSRFRRLLFGVALVGALALVPLLVRDFLFRRLAISILIQSDFPSLSIEWAILAFFFSVLLRELFRMISPQSDFWQYFEMGMVFFFAAFFLVTAVYLVAVYEMVQPTYGE